MNSPTQLSVYVWQWCRVFQSDCMIIIKKYNLTIGFDIRFYSLKWGIMFHTAALLLMEKG